MGVAVIQKQLTQPIKPGQLTMDKGDIEEISGIRIA